MKNKDFMIGCNYWASNAGVEMWRQWDENVVRNDVKTLSENGIDYMRVFPNWRDFQPVHPFMKGGPSPLDRFVTADGYPIETDCYMDETMLERFGIFCDICEEYGVKLVVGIITGFMSGRMYIPPVLYNKDLFTDTTALYLQQKLVEGIVKNFKDKPAIYAWDLGNECNAMGMAQDKMTARNWTMTVSNTIRAYDSKRPVVSGMHSLYPDDEGRFWTIECQAEGCDILTTHPYPYWVEYACKDKNASVRTSMHATCQTKMYGEIGNRPCFAEEIGTMGNMLCDREQAARFMRVNLLSNWANGSLGVMWWCGHEQTNLKTEPYISNTCEVELGMLDANMQPKPVLKETKRIGDLIKSFDFELPDADTDAVCILTKDQDQWGVAYMTYILAKQAGLNISFCYSEKEIPKAKRYILPSVAQFHIMNRNKYLDLMDRVKNGAELYVSVDDGLMTDFEELTGLHIVDSRESGEAGSVEFCGEKIDFVRNRFFDLRSAGAEVLAKDNEGNITISKYGLGDGSVTFVGFPLEAMLLEKNNAFEENYYTVYKNLFKDCVDEHIVVSDDKDVCVTIHQNGDEIYAVAINYSGEDKKVKLSVKDGYAVEKVIYGDMENIPTFEATIVKIKKA